MMASEVGTSRYHRVFLVLRDQIGNGRYPPGSVLPSEQEMSREFGVSRATSRRALAELQAAGVIYRLQGRGTFVREDVAAGRVARIAPEMPKEVRGILNLCSATVHEFEYQQAPWHVREAFGEQGAEGLFQRAVRVRKTKDRPVVHVVSWVRESLGRHWSAEDLATTPVKSLVRRAGIVLTRGTQVTSAVLSEPTIAQRLDVILGAPLLHVERRLFDEQDRPQVFVEMVARPDRFVLESEIRIDEV